MKTQGGGHSRERNRNFCEMSGKFRKLRRRESIKFLYTKSMDGCCSGVEKILSRRTRTTCQKHAGASVAPRWGRGKEMVQVLRQINSLRHVILQPVAHPFLPSPPFFFFFFLINSFVRGSLEHVTECSCELRGACRFTAPCLLNNRWRNATRILAVSTKRSRYCD